MCTVLPPPPLALFWPWQAPGYWLAFAGTLVVVAVGWVTGITALRRQPRAWRRRFGWVLLVAMALCLIAGFSLLLLVALPTSDALGIWLPQQDQAVHAQGCSAVAWQPLWDRALRAIQDAESVGGELMFLGILFHLLLVWCCPLRNGAAPQRQVGQ